MESMIRGYLSRQYDGSYVFSRWRPEIRLMGKTSVLHQAEKRGQVDPWWFGLGKNLCEASIEKQGIELEILESQPFIWRLEKDE